MKAFLDDKSELIFVVHVANGNVLTAIESNIGLVAMADSEASLDLAIREEVETFFKGKFSGTVRVRLFTDRVFSITPSTST